MKRRKRPGGGGKEREAGAEPDKGKILKKVLDSPDGYMAGFYGFTVLAVDGRRACVGNDDLGEQYHAEFGRMLVEADAAASYCGVFDDGRTAGIIAYAGPKSGMNAAKVVRTVAGAVGGGEPGAGSSASFAHAGGMDASKREAAHRAAVEMLF